MIKEILIRSDQESLDNLLRENLKGYLIVQKTRKQKCSRYGIISLILVILTFLLTDIHPFFIILTVLASIVLIGSILILFVLVWRQTVNSRRYKKYIEDFKLKYLGIENIRYILTEDTIEYQGHITDTYTWKELIHFIENDSSFWLLTEEEERRIWIPKSLVNHHDYIFFKDFASKKIHNNN